MNKIVKFHKAASPAFNTGELWVGSRGSKIIIDEVRPWPICDDKWSYTVHYTQSDGSKAHKDIWNFQVRYTHHADVIASGKLPAQPIRVSYHPSDEGNTPD